MNKYEFIDDVIYQMYKLSKSDPIWDSPEESSFIYQVKSDLNIELVEGELPPLKDLSEVLVEKYELKTDSNRRNILNALGLGYNSINDSLEDETIELLEYEFPREVEETWSKIDIWAAYKKALETTENPNPRKLQRKMYDILTWGE